MSLPDLIKSDPNYGEFIIMNYSIMDDGYGGMTSAYSDGAHFFGALTLNTSTQMKIAQAQGVKSSYRLTVTKGTRLPWHTVFRRAGADASEAYRVTTRDVPAPPASSTLDMRYVDAEEFDASHAEAEEVTE